MNESTLEKMIAIAASSRENVFGVLRVCTAMKAPVGLLSGERSALADGGALPRQVPQSATNTKIKIKFPLNMAKANAAAILNGEI